MVTLRRRRSKDGGWIYQVWPTTLPANAPTPAWHDSADVPDCLKGPIAVAVLSDAFHPQLHDADEQEALMSQEEWDCFSFFDAEEEVEPERAHPDWGTW